MSIVLLLICILIVFPLNFSAFSNPGSDTAILAKGRRKRSNFDTFVTSNHKWYTVCIKNIVHRNFEQVYLREI